MWCVWAALRKKEHDNLGSAGQLELHTQLQTWSVASGQRKSQAGAASQPARIESAIHEHQASDQVQDHLATNFAKHFSHVTLTDNHGQAPNHLGDHLTDTQSSLSRSRGREVF